MLILSLDTTSVHGGVGLYRDAETLGERRPGGEANYSVQLFKMTESLLGAAGLVIADVDLLAVANGPGSFTGIRVGLAAAQGWARALSKPVRGISVLEAMVEEANPPDGIALPLLNAHRGEFYLSVFRSAPQQPAGVPPGRRWQSTEEGMALDPARIRGLLADLRSEAPGGPTVVACEGDEAATEFRGRLGAETGEPPRWIVVPSFLTAAIARLAAQDVLGGRAPQPGGLDAFYIRRSDAEMNWRE